MNGPSEGKYRYRVAPDPALDDQRRQLIVASLQFMGVPDADARVVVAPDFAQSATATEAEGAHYSTVGGTRSSGAFGGGFGGFGGIGGGGAFGGGGVSDYPAGGVDSVAGAVGN